MAKGGYRPGAGAKRRKLLAENALEMLGAVAFGLGDSLEMAGREVLHRLGMDDAASSASPADAMRAAVAGIGHDNIRAGNGTRVVEMFVAVMERVAAQNPDAGSSGKSALIEALERCPGIVSGANQAQNDAPHDENPATARLPGIGAMDVKSNGPFFEPQMPLFQAGDLPGLPATPGGARAVSPSAKPGAAGAAGAAGPGRAGPVPPTPPLAPTHPGRAVHSENFEISGGRL